MLLNKKLLFGVVALLSLGQVEAAQLEGPTGPSYQEMDDVLLDGTGDATVLTGERAGQQRRSDGTIKRTCWDRTKNVFRSGVRAYSEMATNASDFLRNTPAVRIPADLATQFALSICMTNYFRGTVFGPFAQHNAGSAFQRHVRKLGLPFPVELAFYAGLSAATVPVELALAPNPGYDDPRYDEIMAREGFVPGLPITFAFAGYEALKHRWEALDKKED